jgi:prophage regulatory protein
MHTTLSNTQPVAAITHQFDPATVIIRISELSVITGYARPTIYKRLKDDPTFPRPVPLSDSKSRGAPVGWVLAEAQDWVRQRIALRSEAA